MILNYNQMNSPVMIIYLTPAIPAIYVAKLQIGPIELTVITGSLCYWEFIFIALMCNVLRLNGNARFLRDIL